MPRSSRPGADFPKVTALLSPFFPQLARILFSLGANLPSQTPALACIEAIPSDTRTSFPLPFAGHAVASPTPGACYCPPRSSPFSFPGGLHVPCFPPVFLSRWSTCSLPLSLSGDLCLHPLAAFFCSPPEHPPGPLPNSITRALPLLKGIRALPPSSLSVPLPYSFSNLPHAWRLVGVFFQCNGCARRPPFLLHPLPRYECGCTGDLAAT